MRIWEIALFVWCWSAVNMTIGVLCGVVVEQLLPTAGLFVTFIVWCLDPVRALEQRSWLTVKANHR